ncbi:calcium ion transporter [Moniliophthora roreri MCA 2997]|uniref:Calcium ion transporter n=2 Tax=Moniliophthora roreri TaxID=221103 RepID=V2YBH3_MONRO|nr:calcium ion transporter [Moniliophthora roreri MCA 2997]
MGSSTIVPSGLQTPAPEPEVEHVEEGEEPQTSLPVAIALLVVVTVLVAVTAEWLVDSIDGLTANNGISQEFVGVILLPIVGNAAEHVTAVTVSVKDKLTLSLGVAVGSSIQIALFVIPFIVILGWIIGKPLTLLFDPYESVTLFLAVITVNYCVQDGKSNWLEGLILIFLYVILGITFWFYPGLQLADRGLGDLQCR